MISKETKEKMVKIFDEHLFGMMDTGIEGDFGLVLYVFK